MNNLSVLRKQLDTQGIKQKFKELIKDEQQRNAFSSSIISAVSANDKLLEADPTSVIGSALVAARLNLPINQNLGYAYIVPYKGKAQFQMGYKGYIQLALRTGQYKTINSTIIYEGQLLEEDIVTGMIKFDAEKKSSDKVVGYLSYFSLLNGYEKMLYMSKEKMEAHAKKYSQSYSYSTSVWQKDFDSMALKTVLKLLISKYGPMTIHMETAVQADQAVVNGSKLEYPDNDGSFPDEEPFIDADIQEPQKLNK